MKIITAACRLVTLETAREQDRANGDRRHHRADESEPLFVRGGVRNSPFHFFAHGITYDFCRLLCPRPRCGRKWWRHYWALDGRGENLESVAFRSQTPPRLGPASDKSRIPPLSPGSCGTWSPQSAVEGVSNVLSHRETIETTEQPLV